MDPSVSREMMCRQAAALVSFVTSRLKRKRPDSEPDPLLYALRDEAEQHRQQTLNLIYNSNDGECISMLRMIRASFFALCNLFRARSLVFDREEVTVEEQVAMFLHVVGHSQRFRVVHQSFTRSIEIVHRHFRQVLYVVGELMNEMIKPPSTTIHPKGLGAIDGIYS